jgi:hypothetical protein
MQARQQLVRTLIADIIVGYDTSSREIVLTFHWRGGQHSELCVRKPKPANTAAAPLTTRLP